MKPTPFIYFLSRLPLLNILSGVSFYLHNGYRVHSYLNKLNQKNKIDYVEYTEGGDFWNAISRKFKYSSHLHGSSYTFMSQSNKKPKFVDWLRRKFELFFIKKANIVFSPSEAMLKLVEQENGNYFSNAHVIPYPIEKNLIKKVEIKDVNKKINIIFASRDDPVKGGELFIDALRILPKELKDIIEVKVFGYVPRNTVNDLSFLKIKTFIPRDDLKKEYFSSDICVIPSKFDNSPNTVYEAMAAGKVLVVSNAGGIPEIIGNPDYGYIFKCGDIIDLKIKLIDAIKLVKTGNCTSMRINAQNHIIKKSDINLNFQKRFNLLNK